MAEWLRRGLQILARRFDSGSGLHLISPAATIQGGVDYGLSSSIHRILRAGAAWCRRGSTDRRTRCARWGSEAVGHGGPDSTFNKSLGSVATSLPPVDVTDGRSRIPRHRAG